MANASHIRLFLSGGASNSDPNLSLGGAISTTAVKSSSLTASSLAGITYTDAAHCNEGTAVVRYVTVGTTLDFAPPGGSAGAAVNVSVDGTYALRGVDGKSILTVSKSGALPGGNTTQSVTVTHLSLGLFDSVSRPEAADGDAEYRCVFVKNAHASESMSLVFIGVEQLPSTQQEIAFGLDVAGKNATPSGVANENTAPSGATFLTGGILVGALAAGDYYPVWVRRTVTSESKTPVIGDTMILYLRFQ